MGDSDGPLAAHRLVGEPRRDARHKVKNKLAAVRRGCGIVQPRVAPCGWSAAGLCQSVAGKAEKVATVVHEFMHTPPASL